MQNRRWTFKKHVVFAFIATMISAISHYLYQWLVIVLYAVKIFGGSIFGGYEAASIAIIGGADGPTANYGGLSGIVGNVYSEYIFLFLVMILLFGPTKKVLNNTFKA